MKQYRIVLTLALLLATMTFVCPVNAQNTLPTATRALQLSAFGAVGGDYTGLRGGKNFDIIAGGDLGLPPWHGVRPTVEVRGTYPSDHGLVDSQKSILGGLKVDFLLNRRLHPYGDFLFGRGQMDYNGQYLYANHFYVLTTTYVYSPGGGVDVDLNEHFTVRLDGQFQHWGATPTPSGHVYSTVGSAGLVYHFTFDRRARR